MKVNTRRILVVLAVAFLVSMAGCSSILQEDTTPTPDEGLEDTPSPSSTPSQTNGTNQSDETGEPDNENDNDETGEPDGNNDNGEENQTVSNNTNLTDNQNNNEDDLEDDQKSDDVDIPSDRDQGSDGEENTDQIKRPKDSSSKIIKGITSRKGPDSVAVNADVTRGSTLVASDINTDSGKVTGINMSRINVTMSENRSVSLTINQSTAPFKHSTQLAGKSPGRSATYFSITHPAVTDEDIEHVEFEFSVRKDRLDPNASEFSVYRQVNGSWKLVSTELVSETESKYILRSESSGFSMYAAAVDDGSTQDSHTANDVINTSYDTFSDGNLNAERYNERALDRANLSAYFINQGLSEMCSSCGAVSKGEVPIEIQMFRIAQANGTTEQKYEKAREVSANELDDADRRAIEGEITPEEYLNQTFTLTSNEKEELVANLRSDSEQVASGITTVGSKANFAISMSMVLLYATGAGFAGQGMADSYAIGYHLNNSGYTQTEYQRLHHNLQKLDTNSKKLANTSDTQEEVELLERRQELIDETYRLLPEYLDGVHDSIIDDAAGREDLKAYKRIRFNVEFLRVTLIEDYEATNRLLEIKSDPSSESESINSSLPQTRTPMPTHGWTVVYSLSDELEDQGVKEILSNGPELSLSYNLDSDVSSQYQTDIFGRPLNDGQFGQSEIYDTMDTSTDYSVYRIEIPEASGPQELTVSTSRPSGVTAFTGNFETRLSTSPPTDPRDPTGDRLQQTDGDSNQSIRQIKKRASESTYYLTVNASGSVGSYQLFASTNESGVSVEPMGRAGPDIQRPNVALRTAPEEKQVDSESAYVSRNESITLGWHAWDIKTDSQDLEYRYRIVNQSGGDAWSSWKRPDSSGDFKFGESLSSGYHNIQVVVRDEAGYRTERVVLVKVDVDGPRLDMSISDDGAAPRVSVTANERLETLRFEYSILNNSASADEKTTLNWTHWQTTDTAGTVQVPEINESSDVSIRARGTDLAGRNSTWVTDTIPPRTTERIYENLTKTTSSKGSVSSNQVVVSEGNGSGKISEEAIVAIQSAYNNSIDSVGTEGKIIDGELVLELYVSSRNLERVRLTSIELTEDDEINITEVVPPEYAADTRVELVFRGSGTAEITNVKTTVGPSDITVNVSPNTPVAGDRTEVSATVSEEMVTDIESYEWDVNDDGTIDATGQSAQFTFSTAGLQKINLTVNDNLGRTATVTKSVNINKPPSSDFYIIPERPMTGEQVNMVSSAVDLDGSIEQYEWDFGADGTVDETGQAVKASFSDNGTQEVELVVTDNNGAERSSKATISVQNQNPSANILLPGEVVDNNSAEFTSKATDLDGEIVKYEWAVDSDKLATGEKVYRSDSLSGGPHTITLRVTDDDGAQNTTTREFRVGDPPTVSVDAPDTAVTGSEIQFDASGSVDVDGTIEAITWDLDGDGRFNDAAGPQINTSFSDDGTYDIQTRVVDDDGLARTESTEIVIQNQPPSPMVDLEQWVVIAGANVTVNAGESMDPDGDIVTYEWNIANNTTRDTGKSTALQFGSPGMTNLSLTVTDDDGEKTTMVKSVEVVEDINKSVRSQNDSDLPGNKIALTYTFENEEDASLQMVTFGLGELPDRWSIMRVESPDGGKWNQTSGELTTDLAKSTTKNTDRVTLRVVLQTPADAAIGNYTVPAKIHVGGVTVAEQTATATLQKPLVTMDTAGDTDAPGNVVRLRYRIENQEDAHIENVSLDFASLPDGWSIETVRTPDQGRWNASTERVSGSLYPFDEGHGRYDDSDEMTLDVKIRIAPDASTRTYNIPAVARVGSKVVQVDSAPVVIRIPSTQTIVENDTDAPGNLVELRYELENQEETTIENTSIRLDEIPEGWQIERVRTYGEGRWNASTQTVHGDLRGSYRHDDLDVRVQMRVRKNESLGNYSIPVTARVADHVVAERNLTANVQIPETTTRVGNDTDAPGNVVEVRYELENQEETTIENTSIRLNEIPEGWQIEQVRTYGEGRWNASTRTVRGDLRGSYRHDDFDIRVQVRVPKNESLGKYSIPVTARVADHVVAERNLTANVRIPETTARVENDTDAAGNLVELRYELENQEETTIENTSIRLDEIPEGWQIERVRTYGEGRWNASTRTVRGDLRGSYRHDDLDVRVQLRIPRNASTGNYSIPMTARVAGHVVAERNSTTNVQIPETTTRVENDTDAAGNLVELRYELENQEETTIENTSIRLDEIPEGWQIERVRTYGEGRWNASTQTVRGDLRSSYRHDDLDVRVQIRVPKNESLGKYSIPVTARVADHVVAEQNLTANVRIPETTTRVENDTDAPGNVVEVRYELENQEDTTIENTSIRLDEIPEGWQIEQVRTYGEGRWNASTQTVRGDLRGSYRHDDLDVRVQMRVPKNESLGKYSIPVTARVANHVVAKQNSVVSVRIPDTRFTVRNNTDSQDDNIELQYVLENREDATIENVSIRLGDLPDDWVLNQVSTYGEGSWNKSTRTIRGDLKSGYRSNELDVRIEVQPPDTDSSGSFTIPVTARVGDHVVYQENSTSANTAS